VEDDSKEKKDLQRKLQVLSVLLFVL